MGHEEFETDPTVVDQRASRRMLPHDGGHGFANSAPYWLRVNASPVHCKNSLRGYFRAAATVRAIVHDALESRVCLLMFQSGCRRMRHDDDWTRCQGDGPAWQMDFAMSFLMILSVWCGELHTLLRKRTCQIRSMLYHGQMAKWGERRAEGASSAFLPSVKCACLGWRGGIRVPTIRALAHAFCRVLPSMHTNVHGGMVAFAYYRNHGESEIPSPPRHKNASGTVDLRYHICHAATA